MEHRGLYNAAGNWVADVTFDPFTVTVIYGNGAKSPLSSIIERGYCLGAPKATLAQEQAELPIDPPKRICQAADDYEVIKRRWQELKESGSL